MNECGEQKIKSRMIIIIFKQEVTLRMYKLIKASMFREFPIKSSGLTTS